MIPLKSCWCTGQVWFICLFCFFRSMYVFGGFYGVLLNDILVYRPPSCQAFSTEEDCMRAGPGVRCMWSRGRCLPWEPSMANGSLTPAPFCPSKASETLNFSFRKFCLSFFVCHLHFFIKKILIETTVHACNHIHYFSFFLFFCVSF